MQLFKAYFTQVYSVPSGAASLQHSSRAAIRFVCLQAKYINDSEILVDAAVAAGFDADDARAVIADPAAYRSEVSPFHARIELCVICKMSRMASHEW